MTAGSLWGGRVFPLPAAGHVPLLPATPLPPRHPASARLCPSSRQTQGAVLFSIRLRLLSPLPWPLPTVLRNSGSVPSWGEPPLTPHVLSTPRPRVSLPALCPGLLTRVSSSAGSSREDGDRCPTPAPAQCRGRLMNAWCWDLCPHCCLRFLLRVNLAKRESLAFPVKGAPR